jgi:DUF1365 family protein
MDQDVRITTLDQNGPPPEAAVSLFPGEVMHARLRPFGHRFVYTVFSLLLDIDRLDEAGKASRIFSVNRPNLASFYECDQTDQQGETLRQFVDRLLAQSGQHKPAARVLLLCYPRIFGYVFNPISVYFVYDAAGDLTALIYAVRNTFGERHTYVAPIRPGEFGPAGVRQERTKSSMSRRSSTWARAIISVFCRQADRAAAESMKRKREPLLAATFVGEQKTRDTKTLATCLLKIPFMTWKITAGIHWEAQAVA